LKRQYSSDADMTANSIIAMLAEKNGKYTCGSMRWFYGLSKIDAIPIAIDNAIDMSAISIAFTS